MSYFEWSSKLDLGVDKMNDEHKVLINLMNKLHDDDASGVNKVVLLDDISKLLEWTKTHFDHEEEFMEKIGFPGLKQHKTIHNNLIKELEKYAADFKASSVNRVPKKFFDFLKLWLQAHIMGIDMKYGGYVAAA